MLTRFTSSVRERERSQTTSRSSKECLPTWRSSDRRTHERGKAKNEAARLKKKRDANAQKAELNEKRARDALKEVGNLRRLLYPWRYELPDVVDLSRSRMSRHGGCCWLHVTIEGNNGYVTKPISSREEAMYEPKS